MPVEERQLYCHRCTTIMAVALLEEFFYRNGRESAMVGQDGCDFYRNRCPALTGQAISSSANSFHSLELSCNCSSLTSFCPPLSHLANSRWWAHNVANNYANWGIKVRLCGADLASLVGLNRFFFCCSHSHALHFTRFKERSLSKQINCALLEENWIAVRDHAGFLAWSSYSGGRGSTWGLRRRKILRQLRILGMNSLSGWWITTRWNLC